MGLLLSALVCNVSCAPFSHQPSVTDKHIKHTQTKQSLEMSPQGSTTLSHKTDSTSPFGNCICVVIGEGAWLSLDISVCAGMCEELGRE